jgi:hypothetical protein
MAIYRNSRFHIGGLMPSVGTNRSQELMLVWIAEAVGICTQHILRRPQLTHSVETNKENTMKIAILAVCVGTLAMAQADIARANYVAPL